MTHLTKSLRAIPKAQAGQKWPAGPALAAPALDILIKRLKCNLTNPLTPSSMWCPILWPKGLM